MRGHSKYMPSISNAIQTILFSSKNVLILLSTENRIGFPWADRYGTIPKNGTNCETDIGIWIWSILGWGNWNLLIFVTYLARINTLHSEGLRAFPEIERLSFLENRDGFNVKNNKTKKFNCKKFQLFCHSGSESGSGKSLDPGPGLKHCSCKGTCTYYWSMAGAMTNYRGEQIRYRYRCQSFFRIYIQVHSNKNQQLVTSY